MVLHIDVVNNEELIHYLTQRQGQLDPDTFLITVSEPKTQVIIPSKERIYSEQFTEESFSHEHSRALNNFIFKLLDHIQTEWDSDYKLLIHSYEKNGIARAIADYIFSVFPEKDINNLYYNTFDLVTERDDDVILVIYQKLKILKEFYNTFRLDI